MSAWGGDDAASSAWGGEDKPWDAGKVESADPATKTNVEASDNFFSGGGNTGFGGGEGGGEDGERPRGPSGPCRKCNEEGHYASSCPNQKCTSCGEKGHSAGSCPTPKCSICKTDGHIAFNCPDKVCLFCSEKGHISRDCEKKAALPCRNCDEVGHRASECKNRRKIFESVIESASEGQIEAAWNALKKANDEKDLDAFKDAFFDYVRVLPSSTFGDLQDAFSSEGFSYSLVAIQKDITNTQTIVDLQGNMGKKYVVTFQTSLQGRRKVFASHAAGRFPEDKEDNKKRLEDAGFIQESYVMFCMICNERGHTSKGCTQERPPRDTEAPKVQCVNCGEEGHRSRDCTIERKQRGKKNACRNCGEEGHMSKECTKPRDASNDCPTAPKFTCRNCDQEWVTLRVNARNLAICLALNAINAAKNKYFSEMGHMAHNCKNPPKADEADDAVGGFGSGAPTSGNNDAASTVEGDWDKPAGEGASASEGGW
ncbi:hypothetical protein ABW19_dt0209943 [Dactylella cylindrospora]|nr:hypothetical protein ABW19_dt0209943 [Dactylella cylindrospora]